LVGDGTFVPFGWSAGARGEAAAFVTLFGVPTVGAKAEDSSTALNRVAVVPSDLGTMRDKLTGAGNANGSWGAFCDGSGAGSARASCANLLTHALFLRGWILHIGLVMILYIVSAFVCR
jgi:hypothetical protein